MCLYMFFNMEQMCDMKTRVWRHRSYGGWIFRLGKLLMMQIMCKLPTWLYLTSYRKQLPINKIITYRQRLAFTLVYTWSRMVNFVKIPVRCDIFYLAGSRLGRHRRLPGSHTRPAGSGSSVRLTRSVLTSPPILFGSVDTGREPCWIEQHLRIR